MSRITPSDQLASLMRAQIGALRSKSEGIGTGKNGRARQSPPTRQSGRQDVVALAAERIRRIAADDPDRARKALRIFLECMLLSELGEDLVAEPSFVRMVDHVHQQLEADPELAAATSKAAVFLLDSAT